jgi:hypothetical protein
MAVCYLAMMINPLNRIGLMSSGQIVTELVRLVPSRGGRGENSGYSGLYVTSHSQSECEGILCPILEA